MSEVIYGECNEHSILACVLCGAPEGSLEEIASAKRRTAKDIFIARETDQDYFTAELLRLIQKADAVNKMRIGKGFPIMVQLFHEWNDSSTEKGFYEQYGVFDQLRDKSHAQKRYIINFGRPLQRAILQVTEERDNDG